MTGGHIRGRAPGSWELRYVAAGKVCTRTVRGSKRDAQAALRAALGAVDRGEHVAKVGLTVGELLRQRIDTWEARGKITARTREGYDICRNIAAPIGDVPVQQLTIGDVERWHLTMRARGLSASSTRAAHGLVRRALADAVKHQLIARNVAIDHGPPEVGAAERVVAPNADQVRDLLAKVAGDPFEAAVITLLFTGLRRNELLALTWVSVDLDRAKLTVTGALEQSSAGVRLKAPKTKAGRRTISLPQLVVETLRKLRVRQLETALLLGCGRPSAGAVVFPGIDGQHDTPRAFTQRWERTAARLGVHVTLHQLRHAHASLLIREGRPITEVADRLGHANPMVTLRIYSHLFDRDDSAAAAAIDRTFGGV